jgi:hypothetical protein
MRIGTLYVDNISRPVTHDVICHIDLITPSKTNLKHKTTIPSPPNPPSDHPYITALMGG